MSVMFDPAIEPVEASFLLAHLARLKPAMLTLD